MGEILGIFQSSGKYSPESDPEPGTSIADLEMADIREFFNNSFAR